MTPDINIYLSIAILLLPLLGFIIVLFWGKRYSKIYITEVILVSLSFILSLVVGISKLTQFISQDLNFSFKELNTNRRNKCL